MAVETSNFATENDFNFRDFLITLWKRLQERNLFFFLHAQWFTHARKHARAHAQTHTHTRKHRSFSHFFFH